MKYVKVTYTDDATGENLVAYYNIEREEGLLTTYITGLSYSHTIKA